MTGLLMLVVFALFAALMYARVMPALLAVPLMALAITGLAGAGPADLTAVVVDGTVRLAPVFVTVIFGALLSRVTIATGIAETIVNYAAEFGGDRPIVLALTMAAVVAGLFVALTGLGAIIMVGSVVLPIMMTVGVPRRIAATVFLLAYALGYIFNISLWTFYTKTFGVERAQLQSYGFLLAAIDAVVLVAFIVAQFRRNRGYATWAVAAEEPVARRRAPPWALITPVLPIGLFFFIGMNPILAFALSALYGALATRPRDAIATIVAAAIRGVEDVAPAVLLFMGIGMLLVATAQPQVKAALEPIVTTIAPRSWLAYVMLFGLFSPLAIYRGPLNPFGVGIAVFTVLAGLHILPALTLVAAVMAVVQVQNVCDPTNTHNVWVANFTGVRPLEITKLTLPFQVAVATAGTLAVVLFGGGLFGTRAFALAAPLEHASAATLVPSGLFAPPGAAHTVAVTDDGRQQSRVATAMIRRQIARGWAGFRVVDANGDPAASDCSRKPFVAVLQIKTTDFRTSSGESVDIGLELADCAGWPVDQWHIVREFTTAAAPTPEVEAGALAALFRLRTWMHEQPQLADALFARGLAYDERASGPTYFFTLFKTNDGQMRAYVRPGGPAWVAGLRTDDIVVKLDGKFWWEYGTFQTQRRAYDGLPHTFVVSTGVNGPQRPVALGAPYP